MPEGFLRRWSRLKATAEPEPTVPVPVPANDAEPAPLPTLADVAQLGADADFSRFVAPDVDSAVRRLALKKLFADPHFNAIDGLDIYMGDFTRADPIPAAMMAALQHARSVFGPAVEEKDGQTVRDPAEPPVSDPAEPPVSDPAEPSKADRGPTDRGPTDRGPTDRGPTDPAEPAGTPAITPYADETTV